MMGKYIVIGLGSMGKRRVRCLQALGVESKNIIGFDTRKDRRDESKNLYGIEVVENLDDVDTDELLGVIVSLPPDKHYIGAKYAIDNGVPAFIEASVVLDDVRKIKEANKNNVFIMPSDTFVHHPIIKKIKSLVKSGKYGKVTNFSYHSGQYLPDWHPWEDVNDFYVSNRVTGGAREIVPYELTWLTDVFGYPKEIKGYFKKTAEIGCDIEDSYAAAIDYGNMTGTLTVDVVARYVARDLIINMQNGQIRWRWDTRRVELYDALTGKTEFIEQGEAIHNDKYGAHIDENMYIEEIDCFLKGAKGEIETNTIEKDIKVLELLSELEDSDGGF